MPDVTPPVVILHTPQMGENIGAAARAMKNFGLRELRLVAPRDGWPNPQAEAVAAGGADIVAAAGVYGTLEAALADVRVLFATTARLRASGGRPVLTPEAAAAALADAAMRGHRAAILFGRESCGLTNAELDLADGLIRIPAHPDFSSLNLAQAVLLIGYAWYRQEDAGERAAMQEEDTDLPATREELHHLFTRLEDALAAADFFRVPEKQDYMIRQLRALITRRTPTSHDIRLLHGVVRALAGRGRGAEELGN